MAEFIAMGVDLVLTAGLYGWYRSSRHNADLVKVLKLEKRKCTLSLKI